MLADVALVVGVIFSRSPVYVSAASSRVTTISTCFVTCTVASATVTVTAYVPAPTVGAPVMLHVPRPAGAIDSPARPVIDADRESPSTSLAFTRIGVIGSEYCTDCEAGVGGATTGASLT